MAGSARLGRTWSGLLAFVLVLVLLGIGAALLANHAALHAPAVSKNPSGLTLDLPAQVWGILFLAPLLVGLAGYLTRLLMAPAPGFQAGGGGGIAPVLVALIVVTLLLVALLLTTVWGGSSTLTLGTTGAYGSGGHGHGPGNGTGAGNGTGGGNSTGSGNGTGANGTGGTGPGGGTGTRGNGTNGTGGTSPGGGNGTGPNGSNGSGGGPPPPPHRGGSYGNNSSGLTSGTPAQGLSLGVPNWVFGAAAAGLAAVVGVLAVPGVLSRLVDRRRPEPPAAGLGASSAEVRSALQEAWLAIEAGESPRGAIVRLYGRLLGRVSPGGHGLETSTAEEIQRTRLAELRVAPERSEAITRMFEEACYSAHPLERPDAERFVSVLRAVDQDLSAGTLR